MTKKNNIIILGCGSSSGVPTIETGWGICNPNNKKNYRLRSSILVNINGFSILIDTSPDLRQQALTNNIKHIDCILYTHEHSDHIAGIDDVRSFNRISQKPIDCYLNQTTYNKICTLFNYVYINPKEIKEKGFYRAVLIPHIIKHNDIIKLNDNITIKALEHSHGRTKAIGYKFNNSFAYITDILEFINEEESINEYKNLDLIIISSCVLKPHPSHMTFNKVLNLLLSKLKPKKAYLTHMAEGIDFNIQTNIIKQQNIENIFLCYDGLKIYF